MNTRIALTAATAIFIAALLATASSTSLRSAENSANEKSSAPRTHFVFADVTESAGLADDIAGIQGHAAGWGDIDGDGFVDLYVGTFHKTDTKPNLLFRNDGHGKFRLDTQTAPRISARTSGALFADFENNGHLDLYVSSMPQPKSNLVGCTLFRNEGDGTLTNVSADNEACPLAFGGRSAAALDFDGDGLLDILVGEDPLPRYNGSTTKSTRLFRNKGHLQFEDVSRAAGLTEGTPGLGVAVGDVNNDGWPDIFVAANNGGNVLYLNDGHGKFREAPDSRKFFAWEGSGGDNMIAGVCIADVNRDGLPDIVIGQHYEHPWRDPVPVRLYLNRGIADGVPKFEDVTAAVGLKPLPLKAPHVEVQDFDNDGWPDIYVSIVKFADGKPYPVIFKNMGLRDGLPHFEENALAVNDFPTADDVALKGSKPFFAKMISEKKIAYMAPGPSADYDNDGKLDLFLASWWPEARSLLLHNETPGGNWLQVQVQGTSGVNRMGLGAKVFVYPAGKLGQPAALLGDKEIATGYGYVSCQPPIAHFGLGGEEAVDIRVILPHGKGEITRQGVKANQRLLIKQEPAK